MTDTLTQADSLRPTDFDGYIGQEKLKQRLAVHIKSALTRCEPMGHTLITGPPGMGKTTLAGIIAKCFDFPLLVCEMPFTTDDYRNLRSFTQVGGILALEEIHRASKTQQEDLLPLLEHGDLTPKGRFKMHFPWLTVVSMTTRRSKVIEPLRDRHIIQPYIDPYTDEELGRIVANMATKVGIELAPEDTVKLGQASLGVPRRASHMVLAARDMADAGQPIDAEHILEFMRYTPEGLAPDHVEYLTILYRSGAPVGLAALKSYLGQDESGVREIEDPLIGRGFVEPSSRGRELSEVGYPLAQRLYDNN